MPSSHSTLWMHMTFSLWAYVAVPKQTWGSYLCHCWYACPKATRFHHYTHIILVLGNACGQCAERMEKLLAKLQMVADQHPATNKTNVCINTVTFQYQPKSCRDIAKFNPDSPSGYYWLCAEDGILHQIHCLFDEPTENSPALTCKQIKQKLPSSQSGYYWLRNPDGIAVQALCDMED